MYSRPTLLAFLFLLLLNACGSSSSALPTDLRNVADGDARSAPPEDTRGGLDLTLPDGAPLPDLGGDREEPPDVPVNPDVPVAQLDLVTEVTEPPALRLSEVVTRPLGEEGNDWFEVEAVGAEPVDLSEYRVVDGDPDHVPATLPAVTLQPGEFFVVEAVDKDDWSAEPFVPFKLGGDDELLLIRGNELVDRLSWRGQPPPRGTALGRLDEAVRLLQPTPGAANKLYQFKLIGCADPFLTDRVVPLSLAPSASDWETLLATAEESEYVPADFTFAGKSLVAVGMRIKGGSSIAKVTALGSHRYSFKVDFNRYVDQHFCGLKKVVLNNAYGDPSLLREHLAYRLARQMGLQAPRTMFVDLTVAGEHLGIYLMVEPVDDEFFLDDNFGNDKGDLYEADMPGGSLLYAGETIADYPGLEIENNKETTDHSGLLALIGTLDGGSMESLETMLHVKSVLRYAAWSAALANLNGYLGSGRNYYLYADKGIFSIVPWDAGDAFGSYSCGCSAEQLLTLTLADPTCGPLVERPLLARLLEVAEHDEKYRDYLQELTDEVLLPMLANEWLAEAAELVRPHMGASEALFYSADEFEAALVGGVEPAVGPGPLFGLADFLATRTSHLAAQFAGAENDNLGGAGNCPPQ